MDILGPFWMDRHRQSDQGWLRTGLNMLYHFGRLLLPACTRQQENENKQNDAPTFCVHRYSFLLKIIGIVSWQFFLNKSESVKLLQTIYERQAVSFFAASMALVS